MIGARPLTSISKDRELAEKTIRPALAHYLPHLHPLSEFAGIREQEVQAVNEDLVMVTVDVVGVGVVIVNEPTRFHRE